MINVKNFGALGDGVTSDTVAIQLAIDYANSQGGGIVYLPIGTYLLDTINAVDSNTHLYSENQSNVVLQGEGFGTIIKANSTDKDIWRLKASGYCGIKNLRLSRIDAAASGGNGVHFFNGYSCPRFFADSVRIEKQYFGVYYSTSRSQGSKWRDCLFENNVSHGVYLKMNNEEFFTSCEFITNGGDGIRIGDPSVVKPSNGSVYLTSCVQYGNGGNGITIEGNATYRALNVFITGGISDTNIGDGLYIKHCRNVCVSAFRSSFNLARGLYMADGAQEVIISSSDFSDNEQEGIYIAGGQSGDKPKNITMSAINAVGNNRSATGCYGIKIQNTLSNVSITGLTTGSGEGYVTNNGVTGDITIVRSNQYGGILIDASTTSPTNVSITSWLHNDATPSVTKAGTIAPSIVIEKLGITDALTGPSAPAWNTSHLVMGGYHIWIDDNTKLRLKAGTPTSASDGTLI